MKKLRLILLFFSMIARVSAVFSILKTAESSEHVKSGRMAMQASVLSISRSES